MVEVVDVTVEDQGHIALIPNVGVLRNHTRTPLTKIWQIPMATPSSTRTSSSRSDRSSAPSTQCPRRMARTPSTPARTAGISTTRTSPSAPFITCRYFGPVPWSWSATSTPTRAIPRSRWASKSTARSRSASSTWARRAASTYARIETADHWVFPADAPTLEEAIEQSAVYAAEFLVDRLDISMEDATYLLCAVGNVRISQAAFAYYNVTVRTEVPKSVDRRGRLAGYAG